MSISDRPAQWKLNKSIQSSVAAEVTRLKKGDCAKPASLPRLLHHPADFDVIAVPFGEAIRDPRPHPQADSGCDRGYFVDVGILFGGPVQEFNQWCTTARRHRATHAAVDRGKCEAEELARRANHRHCEEHLRRSNPVLPRARLWIASLRSQ